MWYDRFADALLGDEELNTNIASTRYALICQKCFTHNGLVKEEELEDAQFRCMRCNHFNPSKRALKTRADDPIAAQGHLTGSRHSISPSDMSFDSVVSSSPLNSSAARPQPSAVPKPPSPLSNTIELSEDDSIESTEDNHDNSAAGMEVDS